jgi:hypothetical protein
MLRDSRKFQFAVGLTAILIVLRWLITGDLLLAVEAAKPPAEGETKSLTLIGIVGPMLIEACVIVGTSLIAWTLRLWDVALTLVDRLTVQATAATPTVVTPVVTPATDIAPSIVDAPASATIAAEPTSAPAAADPRSMIDELAKAVAMGDTEKESTLRKEIRKPYLRLELSESVKAANWERAKQIVEELEAMDSGAAKPAAKKRPVA